MKTFLRFGLLTTVLATALLPALRASDETPPPAAGDRNPAPRPLRWRRAAMRHHFQHLSQTLNLSPEQKAQVKAIFRDHAPQIQDLRDDEARSREVRRAKFDEIRQDMRTKVRAVLTPEQQAKFDALPRPAWGTRGRGPGQQLPPGNEPPAHSEPPSGGSPAAGGSA